MVDHYPSLPALDGIYLEESWVLDVREASDRVTFRLEAVLTPVSPLYQPPEPGAQFCTRRGNLEFEGVTAVEWLSKTMRRIHDPRGDDDLGNIDSLTREDDALHIQGEWGNLRIHSRTDPYFIADSIS